MSQVASETSSVSRPLPPARANSARQSQANDGNSPFASMVDDSPASPPADTAPPPSQTPSQDAAPPPSQAQTDTKPAKPVQDAKTGQPAGKDSAKTADSGTKTDPQAATDTKTNINPKPATAKPEVPTGTVNPDPVAAGDETKAKDGKAGKSGKDKKADADAASKPGKDGTASATPAAPDPTAAQAGTPQDQSRAQAQPQTQTGAAIVVAAAAAAAQAAAAPAPAVIATGKPSDNGKTPEVTAVAAAGSVAKVEIAGGPAAKEPASTAQTAPPAQTAQPAQDAATPDAAPQATADGKPVPAPAADGSQKADEQKSFAAARGEAPANAPRFTLPDPSGTAPANNQNANAQSAANAAQTLSIPNPGGQAAAHAATAATAATAAALPPQPPAAPVPLAGVAVAIAARASAGTNHFAIRLDPPELGRIEVRLNVDKDGSITSHLVADRKDTLALLQRDVSGLQRTLQDAGFKTAENGLQFSLRDSGQQQQQQQQQQQPNGGNAGHLVLSDETAPAVEALPSGYGRYLGRAGGVDIRV